MRIPVSETIKTPYGNVTHTTYQTVGMIGGPYGSTGPVSRKYEFTVVLQNDSSFTVKTKIDIKAEKHLLVVKKKKEKWEITPDQTREISRLTYPANTRLVGIPSDSCWLFQSIQGRISAYSYLAELNSEYLVAVRKYNGPIVKLTPDALKEMLEDHEKALKHWGKKQYKQAIEAYNR